MQYGHLADGSCNRLFLFFCILTRSSLFNQVQRYTKIWLDKKIVLLQKTEKDMIKIGDRVKFLNDVGGGIVTGFMGKNMVYVENEDGFEVPYPVSKLINVDDPSLNRGEPVTEKPEVIPSVLQKEEEPSGGIVLKGKDSPDFYFCIVPFDSKNPVGGNINLYLVNDSNYIVLYQYAHYMIDQYKTIKYGEVKPNSRIELEVLGQDELAELPDYYFQLICFREEGKEAAPAVSRKFRVNPVKFYKERSFQPNSFFQKNALIFQITNSVLSAEIDKLTNDDLKKVLKAKEKEQPEQKIIKSAQPEIIEVDLHIQELIDNAGGLSNKEMLDLQIEKVENEMRAAIQSKAKRIVFIHGVGQGVLKQEVAKLLRSKFPKYSFQDASFQEYGYGATMVILRK